MFYKPAKVLAVYIQQFLVHLKSQVSQAKHYKWNVLTVTVYTLRGSGVVRVGNALESFKISVWDQKQ